MFLLDTNVISELLRPAPHAGVEAHVGNLPPHDVFTSSICEAEIRYGIARLPLGRRRSQLEISVDAFFLKVLDTKVLAFDRLCAEIYGDIRAGCESRGNANETEDFMIAAVARARNATLVTRNVRHFAGCGVKIVDPWVTSP